MFYRSFAEVLFYSFIFIHLLHLIIKKMAKIKTSALIADIKGTVGGNVFASNKGGNYVRRGKKPTNANTDKQRNVRGAFGTQSGLWRTLTDIQRRTWIEGAVNFPYTDALGETKVYSGQQLFNKLNNNLIQYGATTLDECPTPQSFPLLNFGTVTNQVAGDTLTVEVTFGDEVAVPAGFVLSFSATAPLSAGISSPARQRFKNIAVLPDATSTDPYDLMGDYSANFGGLLINSTIYIGIMLVNTISGEASPMVTIKSERTA
jgi:hypothetical protein